MKETLQKEGLALEELEAQPVGLLPDRVEMRRRRRRRRGGVFVYNENTNTSESFAGIFIVVRD